MPHLFIRKEQTVEAWRCPADDAMWPAWLHSCNQRHIREGEWAVLSADGTVAIYTAVDFPLLFRPFAEAAKRGVVL